MRDRTYISFDWALKRLLRDKANFEVLEGFISTLLEKDLKIRHLLESEGNKDRDDAKYNRVDLLAVDENGEQLLGPLKTDNYISFTSDSDRIVVQEDGICVVYDVEGNELFRATDYGIQFISAYEDGFAYGDNKTILDPDGRMLISDFYIAPDSLPLLPLTWN